LASEANFYEIRGNMKINNVIQLFCTLVLLTGCRSSAFVQSVQTPTSQSTTQSIQTPTIKATTTRAIVSNQIVTNMPIFSFDAITLDNLQRLVILRQWDVENLFFYRSANFWFSNSDRFIIPTNGNNPVPGIQSFQVDSSVPFWFSPSLNLDFTIDENDRVIINWTGMHIFNREGVEIQTIQTNKLCDVEEPASNYIVSIPGTNLVVTGQQDSSSDLGLNNVLLDKARLLIWDINKNSCSELVEQFDGFLSSLSASYDGHYISYTVVITTTDPTKAITRVYDLDLKKEKCKLSAGFVSRFSRQNLLAVYDPKQGTIDFVTLDDCTTKTKIQIGTEVDTFAISPSGDILL
jgi:hypothetical protein